MNTIVEDPATVHELTRYVEREHPCLRTSYNARCEQVVVVGQTGAVPDDLEQLQQRHDRLQNEMDALAEEIERLEHEWKSQQQI
jgi:cell division protein ZapA (FtsZ GTPase activity inhibitor)